MYEGELARSVDDKHRFDLAGFGWVRGQGWLTQRADAGSELGHRWTFSPAGWTGGRAEALDVATGLPVGDYRRTGAMTHKGTVTWGGAGYELRPVGWAHHRYAISDGQRVVVELQLKGWGKRPVRVSVDDSAPVEAGLVLFTIWLARLFVTQDSATASV